jgi:hypothetical protein
VFFKITTLYCGTFVGDTPGSFVTDTPGTFVSDMTGTFGVILSLEYVQQEVVIAWRLFLCVDYRIAYI